MRQITIAFFVMLFFAVAASASTSFMEPTRDEYASHEQEMTRHSGIREIQAAVKEGRLQAEFAKALDANIQTVTGELFARGYIDVAYSIRNDWETKYRAMWQDTRDIKDHPDAIKFIGEIHMRVEQVIGISLCRSIHAHDLYILNKTALVIFKPCGVEELEYAKCFSGKVDTEVEYGGVSVVDYWITYGICAGASMGTMFFPVCGLVASLSEYAFCHLIGERLSDFVWEKSCQ